MKELTVKQSNFIDGVMSGLSDAAAYRASYNVENMKPLSINRKAHELRHKVNIAAMIEERKAELAQKQLWTREKSVERLSTIAEDDLSKDTDKIASVKELNAMHGYNAPQKHDLTSSDGSMTPKPTTREEIDAEIRALGIDPDKVALDE